MWEKFVFWKQANEILTDFLLFWLFFTKKKNSSQIRISQSCTSFRLDWNVHQIKWFEVKWEIYRSDINDTKSNKNSILLSFIDSKQKHQIAYVLELSLIFIQRTCDDVHSIVSRRTTKESTCVCRDKIIKNIFCS